MVNLYVENPYTGEGYEMGQVLIPVAAYGKGAALLSSMGLAALLERAIAWGFGRSLGNELWKQITGAFQNAPVSKYDRADLESYMEQYLKDRGLDPARFASMVADFIWAMENGQGADLFKTIKVQSYGAEKSGAVAPVYQDDVLLQPGFSPGDTELIGDSVDPIVDWSEAMYDRQALARYMRETLQIHSSEIPGLVEQVLAGELTIDELGGYAEDLPEEAEFLSGFEYEEAIEMYEAGVVEPTSWEEFTDSDQLPELDSGYSAEGEGDFSLGEDYPLDESGSSGSSLEPADVQGDGTMSFGYGRRGYGGGGVRVGRKYVFSDTPRPGFYYRRFRNGTGAYVKPRRY